MLQMKGAAVGIIVGNHDKNGERMIGSIDLKNATGFVFDCDGTLLDTLDAWETTEESLFSQIPYPLTQEQEDEIHAAPIAEAARILHEKYGVGESNEAVLAHFDSNLLPFYAQEARALPGACELVRKIHSKGIPCVVVSSSPTRYLVAGLKRAGILDCFAKVVSTEDVGVSKQDHRIYDVALEALGAQRSTTWAVDDAPYACKVMGAYGFKTIAPVNGATAERRARQEEVADVVVETLEELLECF